MSNPPQMDRRPAGDSKPANESAYEQLEERSNQLNDERRDGGVGGAQAPEAPKPLLHPAYSEAEDSNPSGEPAAEERDPKRR